jgi:REP element-mobilizing transposase RayT
MRQLELPVRTWGGRRRGAGRKPGAGRRTPPHRPRVPHDPRCPVHVTLRARSGLPSLRSELVFPAILRAFRASSRDRFRLLHFSVQSDHLHLVVEADATRRFAPGVQGLAIRVARAINRVLRRGGPVWDGRYHSHELRTPREVRNALVYVLQSFRKHLRGVSGIDPRSSARWFHGWRRIVVAPLAAAPVVAARTWLARNGWRRHGPLDLKEAPRSP